MKIERAQVCAGAKSVLSLFAAVAGVGFAIAIVSGAFVLFDRAIGASQARQVWWVFSALWFLFVGIVLLGIARSVYRGQISDCRRAVELGFPFWYWLPLIGRPLPPLPPEPERDLVADFMRTASWNLVMDREQLLRAYDKWLEEDEEDEVTAFGNQVVPT